MVVDRGRGEQIHRCHDLPDRGTVAVFMDKRFDKISDASPKYVLSLDRVDLGHDGIEHLNIVDFLLHKVDLHLS